MVETLPLDSTWTENVELRLAAIEDALTSVWHMMENVINKEQFNRLNVIRQREITNLIARIDALAVSVEALSAEIEALS